MTIARIKSATLGLTLASLAGFSTPTLRAADEAEVKYQPFTLGLEAGSTGPGVSADWRFADHFGARLGVNGFFGGSVDFGTRDLEGNSYNTKLKLMSEPLALDIYPWETSSFRVTVGVLINQSELTGTGVPDYSVNLNGEFNINGIFYQSANGIGDLNLKVEQMPVAPYVSIGMNFYLDKDQRWSVGGELGVAYTGNPDVTLSTSSGAENGDPLLRGNLNAEAQQIEDGAWKFYPIVKASINFSF